MACLSSCSNQSSTETQNSPEYNSAYICPMHCEGSGSSEPGTCPVCGMDYVENTEDQKQSLKSRPTKMCGRLATN